MKPEVSTKPVRMQGLRNVIALAAGFEPLAVLSDGTAWTCWQRFGKNSTTAAAPYHIQGLKNVQAISATGTRALALDANGRIACLTHTWKKGTDDGMEIDRQVEPVEEVEDAIALSAGGNHNLVMRRDGSTWVWGNNDFGQLGDESSMDSEAPVPLRLD